MSTNSPCVIIDFTPLLYHYFAYPSGYVLDIYHRVPKARQALIMLGLDEIIASCFYAPSDIPGQEQYIWDVIASNHDDVQELLESDIVALQHFEILVDSAMAMADSIIEQTIKYYLPSVDYGRYVFSSWVGNPMNQLAAVFKLDPSFES